MFEFKLQQRPGNDHFVIPKQHCSRKWLSRPGASVHCQSYYSKDARRIDLHTYSLSKKTPKKALTFARQIRVVSAQGDAP